MAKKKRKKPTKKQQQQNRKYAIQVMGGVGVLISFFAFLKLGFFGILWANVFRLIGGDTFQFLAIIFGIYSGYVMIFGHDPRYWHRRLTAIVVGYLSLLLLWEILTTKGVENGFIAQLWQTFVSEVRHVRVSESMNGGFLGAGIYTLTHFLVARVGSYLFVILGMIAAVFLFFNLSVQNVLQKLQNALIKFQQNYQDWKAEHQEKQAKKEAQKVETSSTNPIKEPLPKPLAEKEPQNVPVNFFDHNQIKEEIPAQPVEGVESEEVAPLQESDFNAFEEVEDDDYQLPASDLLTQIPKTDQSAEYDIIEKNSVKLKQTFDSFGVDVEVVSVSLGPAVTKYELKPAIGVKVAKIVNLADDLALALAAKDIRIEAPIPGKSLIGIEVPNATTSMISFRDVVEAQPAHPDKLLEVPLGRDISGKVVMADLSKMPHLLVAGSTGSGKSVCINGIITSVLMNAKPNEVKMMLIDPKMVELNVYNGIPHLLTPVVTNPRRAAQALKKVVSEMERRYELFAASGQRNMAGYNSKVREFNQTAEQKQAVLPYIVVIVDELADLMMVASNEVEDAIIRLAQMARAAGIHMILATQRPSVDVITGLIKANVPSRIAFAVSSGVDSRTILDSNGAEKLLGRGDMLFLPMGQNKPTRIQGAFISDDEVEHVVSFITEQRGSEYMQEMLPTEADDQEKHTGNNGSDSEDELFDEAVQLVSEMQTASASMLQRRFRIGFNRAGRLIDEMEQRGMVGPSEGSKPRQVHLPKPNKDEPENN